MTYASKEEPAYDRNPIRKNLSLDQKKILAYLGQSGIQVIKQGMQFTFVIPTDCYFVRTTRVLKPHRAKVLDRLAQFLDSYSHYFAHPRITITGYTDKVWLAPARDTLSLHYAQMVAAYLYEDGIPSHIITVVGAGAKNPIGGNQYPMGASFNRRVVIMVH